MHRRFVFIRDKDETGISGEGLVVEGVRFSDGHCSYRWMTEYQTDQLADSMEKLVAVHGHNGRTRIVFLDDERGMAIPTAVDEVRRLMKASEQRWKR